MPPCTQEFITGCQACNNETISDFINMPCANITTTQLSTYCTEAERNSSVCDMTSGPVCGTSFRWIMVDGEWRSSNGTLLPADGSWKPTGNSTFMPGEGQWIDGEWFGSTEMFGNFMNNFNQTNFANRCVACEQTDIDFVTDGECVIYIPIPIPVILPGIPGTVGLNSTNGTNGTNPNGAVTILPLVPGQSIEAFSFCPPVVNLTASCPLVNLTNPSNLTNLTNSIPVCGLLRACNTTLNPNCALTFDNGCQACQNLNVGMVLNGNCTTLTPEINSLAALWRRRTAIKRIQCINRCTNCPNATIPLIEPVCAFQSVCPTTGNCFSTMNSPCLACQDPTVGFYYDGRCTNTMENASEC